MAVGANEALAREGSEDLVAQIPEETLASADAEEKPGRLLPGDGTGTTPPVPTRLVTDADLEPLLDALAVREERIRKREEAFEVRMQALAVAEEEIQRNMEALTKAEESLKATLSLARTAAEDDITRLTDVYANMKPKHAAALFEEMDPEFAAGFLGRMRPNAAAAIMAGMTPQAAYLTSVILAGRNADVPKE